MRACARRSSASAIPSGCATMCRCRSRPRSPTALTGLHNRRYMESHLGKLVEQAAARGKPLAVLVLDIDFFKSINDNLRPRLRRRRAARIRHPRAQVDPRHRSRLPHGRRGIRGGDAGNRHGGGDDGRRAAAPQDRRPSRSRSSRARSRSTSLFRSALRRWKPRTTPPLSS